VASYEYNPVGATTAKTYENGLSALYRYDAAQRLIGLEHRRGLDLLAKIDYTLDKVGNRKSKAQSVLNPLTENYNYDAVDQLIEAKYGTARTVGYQYDAVGNRQWVSDNGTTAHYTANSDNGYTSVDGISTETDLNGNMVSVPGGAYAYDAQNRLTSAIVNGMTTEFTYDSRNRVMQRTSGNGTLNLTYSGWNLIEERNGGGALEQVYVHGAGIDEILVKVTTSGPAYYHHDGLGSTIALTGENGELLESYRYDAFGAVTILSPSTLDPRPSTAFGNRFLFTGREWLSQVGLYDYRNRVYSAQIGRFLQTDPIRFAAGDGNLYRYVGNNPALRIDPSGKYWQVVAVYSVGYLIYKLWVFFDECGDAIDQQTEIVESRQRIIDETNQETIEEYSENNSQMAEAVADATSAGADLPGTGMQGPLDIPTNNLDAAITTTTLILEETTAP
jgi:RHS repeat-associated protein